MARRQPNMRLAALLAESGWSANKLARAVNTLGAAQSLALRYDRSSVAHWLTGSRPRAPVPDLVAGAFSRRTGRLVTAEETGLTQLSHMPGFPSHAPSGEAAALHQMVTLTRADTDPARRAFLVRSVYHLAAVTLPEWQDTPFTSPATVARRRASPADAEMLRGMTHVFADLAERHGGAHARSALAVYLADDASRLLVAGASGALRRNLFTACAQLTHLLGMMTADAGHHGLAQSYYRAALALARDAGDRVAYAVTLRAMSAQALSLGHPPYALDLADAAVSTAGSTADDTTMAFLLSQLAVARANSGLRRDARVALASAETHHGRAAGVPGPFTGYPLAGLDYQRAQVLLALGQQAEALSALRDSARHRAPGRCRTSALTEASLAEVLLTVGYLEEACTHWHQFLDRCPQLHSARSDQALTRLRHALGPHRRQRHAAAVWDRAHALSVALG
ncbi:hypothetical protein ACFT9I_02250 [Streptomyces sp. NPDC057137]|uniref:hypothetical protein n=1 Tax=Streptomyces sp. NPDC057137 TaxID=3346030 RepID=UPI00364244A2